MGRGGGGGAGGKLGAGLKRNCDEKEGAPKSVSSDKGGGGEP